MLLILQPCGPWTCWSLRFFAMPYSIMKRFSNKERSTSFAVVWQVLALLLVNDICLEQERRTWITTSHFNCRNLQIWYISHESFTFFLVLILLLGDLLDQSPICLFHIWICKDHNFNSLPQRLNTYYIEFAGDHSEFTNWMKGEHYITCLNIDVNSFLFCLFTEEVRFAAAEK